MAVRIGVQLTRRPAEDQHQKSSLLLSCAALWEPAVIKSVCVALHMEFLIVLSCGERWREWEKASKGEVFYSPALCYAACRTLLAHRKSFHFNGGGALWHEGNLCFLQPGAKKTDMLSTNPENVLVPLKQRQFSAHSSASKHKQRMSLLTLNSTTSTIFICLRSSDIIYSDHWPC